MPPAMYTCDGTGFSPFLAWTDAPEGTAELAVMSTTLANDGLKWDWREFGVCSPRCRRLTYTG